MKKRIILSVILLSLMISGCNKKDDSSSDLSNDNKVSSITTSSSISSVEVILPPDAVDFILFVNSIVIDEKAGIYIEEAWDMYEALGDNWNYPQVSEAYYKLIYLESLYNDYIVVYNEALNFIEKVEEIPYLLSLNDEVYILSAEAEYENLSNEAKGILGVREAYERLLKARKDYDNLYLQSIEEERQENIDNFISLVNKIPSIDKLTVDDEDKINNALAAYEILSDELKEENSIIEAYNKLLELQEKYKELLDIVITLNANGGTCDVETLEIVAKEAIGTLPTPTRDNYIFDGWYTALEDGEEVTSTSTFKESTTIYAMWKEIVGITITLNANGGVCNQETITSTNEQAIGTLPTPTKEGYNFLGWYTALEGGNKVNSSTLFEEDTIIYALWREKSLTPYVSGINTAVNGAWVKYSLTWDDDAYDIESIYSVSAIDGTISFSHFLDTQTINNNANTLNYGFAFSGTGFQTPNEHTLTVIVKTTIGYYSIETRFIGASGSGVDMEIVSTTVTELVSIAITLDANGGTCDKSSLVMLPGSGIGTLPIPTKEGYSFLGWYTALEDGEKVSRTTTFDSATTIYALWEEQTGPVIYKSGINTAVNGAWLRYTLIWTDDAYDIESIESVSSIDGNIKFSGFIDYCNIDNNANTLNYGFAFGGAGFQTPNEHTLTVIVKTTDGSSYSITTTFIGCSGINADMEIISTEVVKN